ncbi:3-hydroxyacyl-CoA dehydrogenase family protein [Falsigemmobacter faecalis]|uniref:3-hydroxyacyl-CoA dehydrogenase n=1 Tax=Falsigemmobacter faecalis TaxID=2488730 RepID=A0A3P3DRQ1_9RHOB|nr:3-hydroxyacyl-CoA dehydrogenase NAD-binding domain-containing protein [Falsigemmobacter faecalis]RRH76624.1 3-hydroxyacyl-CoA dehydrogenase [Falsigemmobacter faecalis]
MEFPQIAVLGAGVIGASWAALFAASGRQVVVADPEAEAEEKLARFVEEAAPVLRALGWEGAGDLSRIRFVTRAEEAVETADFIQENTPERLEVKHSLFARIAPLLKKEATLATSSSGLKLSEMAKALPDAGGLILAHPFNPPHLIPLVELMGTPATRAGVLEQAERFYTSLGKTCVRLNREVTGHIANRLQAAVFREAVHLALSGVADFGEIDKAMTAGPGLRWSVMGPSTLFHLGGGAAGMAGFLQHLGDPMQSWWDDLGRPDLTPGVRAKIAEGVSAMLAGQSISDLAATRDRAILAALTGGRLPQ